MTMRKPADKAPGPDQFGFLPLKWSFNFDGGNIVPVPEFDSRLRWVKRRLHRDGFLYPPLCRTVQTRANGKDFTIPRTKRPSLLHPVPASHELTLTRQLNMNTRRDGDAAFVVHWLGWLFDTRLQFSDWWFDGRIPIERTSDPLFSAADVERRLSGDYRKWIGWHLIDQKRFINILYMHCRVPSYEWDWENFSIEYIVFDACWKMAERLGIVKGRTRHADKISKLGDKFSIPITTTEAKSIVELRNELFHEALWQKERPCGYSDASGAVAFYKLRGFNHELIGALLNAS
jgi:hypothetical protein